MPPSSPPVTPTKITIDDIRALVNAEMLKVDQLISKKLHSEVTLVNRVADYIIHSGGKRLRPMLVLLCARALSYQGTAHLHVAAIVEFIHTATLLHDDVVDNSSTRRGHDTANALWGNEASVLVGDFLYSRAFQMMVRLDDMRVMDILADTTNVIAEGEVMQLLNCHNPDVTYDQYLSVIQSKTAKLFEAAGRISAVINNSSMAEEEYMAAYGLHIGIAFQVIDDVLDLTGDKQSTGKDLGADLAEGKPTLPLIYAMQAGTEREISLIRRAITTGNVSDLDSVLETIKSTGAIEHTAGVAKHHADLACKALSNIAPSQYRNALLDLAQFSVDRKH